MFVLFSAGSIYYVGNDSHVDATQEIQTNNDHSNGDKEQNTILPSSMEGQEESKDLADS